MSVQRAGMVGGSLKRHGQESWPHLQESKILEEVRVVESSRQMTRAKDKGGPLSTTASSHRHWEAK